MKHVIPSIADVASGPTYSVQSLCREQCSMGLDIELLTTRVSLYGRIFSATEFQRRYILKSKLAFAPDLFKYLQNADYDILHNHSLWMMPNVYPGMVARKLGKNLITSPRGTFSDWAIRKNRVAKFLMWTLGQRLSIVSACCIHATSLQECSDLRRKGVKKPICVIPNGYQVPANIPERTSMKKARRFLYLGRLHPIKGLESILAAWKDVQSLLPEWELQFVGPGDKAYVSQLMNQIRRDDLQRVLIREKVEGEHKRTEYLQADIYILASHSENFAMTVVEALGHGLPCIVSKGAPWEEIESNRCGKWVSNDAESLRNAMLQLGMLNLDELIAMGARGREFVDRCFSWNKIASQMIDVYDWVNKGMVGSIPATIQNS